MTLPDAIILEEIKNNTLSIDPFDLKRVQPASVDLLLGTEFKAFKRTYKPYIDVKESVSEYMEDINVAVGEKIIIHPGEFLLGHTIEYIKIPSDLVGRLEGKSSLGRLGLIVHSTAGFFDPGFEGQPTLEITNIGTLPLAIYPGMKVCQMSFHRLESPATKTYGDTELKSKYHGQKGATASEMHKNFE